MTPTDIEQKIREIIRDVCTMVKAEALAYDISLAEQGVDSLDMFNMWLGIETEYGIKIPDEDISGLRSIKDIVQFVERTKG